MFFAHNRERVPVVLTLLGTPVPNFLALLLAVAAHHARPLRDVRSRLSRQPLERPEVGDPLVYPKPRF